MNWNDFAKKYNIDNPLEFFADLENVSRKAQQPALKQANVSRRVNPYDLSSVAEEMRRQSKKRHGG